MLISNLWNHCVYCPICKKNCRNICIKFLLSSNRLTNKISVLNTKDIKNFIFSEENNILKLKISIKSPHRKYRPPDEYLLEINSVNNSIHFENSSTNIQDELLLYIQASCDKCFSYAYSSNIKLNTITLNAYNIYLKCEDFYLLDYEDKYFLHVDYHSNETYVSRVTLDKNNEFIFSDKKYKFPIFDFKSLDQDKIIKKIKTMLMFV